MDPYGSMHGIAWNSMLRWIRRATGHIWGSSLFYYL